MTVDITSDLEDDATRRNEGDAESVARRWAALWSTGDLRHADRVFADNVLDHRTSPMLSIEGIDGEKRFIASIRAAFPDLRVDVEDVVVQGNRVAARVVHRGTHRGTFLGLAPTGRAVTYEGTVIFRVENERVAERWGTVDLFGLVQQIAGSPVVDDTVLSAMSGFLPPGAARTHERPG